VNDNLWREVQTSPSPEVPFAVLGIPHRVLEVCSELQYTAPASPSLVDSSPTPFIMFPLRLAKIREIVLARPIIDEAKLVEVVRAHVKEVQDRDALLLQYQSVRKRTKGTKRRVVEENVRETRKVEEAARQGQSKVLEMQNELRLVTEKQDHKSPAATQGDEGGTAFNRSSGPTWQMPMSRNPLSHARVVTSRSSKLNYLLKEARIFIIIVFCRLSGLGFGTFSDGEIPNIFQHAFDAGSCRRRSYSHRCHVPSIHNCFTSAHPPTIRHDV
jgi:hypothetical protein